MSASRSERSGFSSPMTEADSWSGPVTGGRKIALTNISRTRPRKRPILGYASPREVLFGGERGMPKVVAIFAAIFATSAALGWMMFPKGVSQEPTSQQEAVANKA